MTPWRWTAYCLFTFALAVLAFRFAVDPPHMLAVGVAAVVLGVLALVFALNSENHGGPLSARGNDVLAALGWAGGVIGLAFFPPQPSWAWVVAMIGLLTAMQRYAGRQWYG